MIIKLLDGTIIHDGRSRILIDPVLKRGLNKAGELSFTIRPEDVGYNHIFPKVTMIDVIDNDMVIWSGRVDTCPVSDLFKTMKVTASGLMALLDDTYCILERSSGEYWETLMQAVNEANAVTEGSTPISIYAESDVLLNGFLWCYWQEGGAWKRHSLTVHQTGSEDLWVYFCTILRNNFYIVYDGSDSPRIRLKIGVHGNTEKTFVSDDPLYQMWRATAGENASSPGTAAQSLTWYIGENLILNVESGNVYNLKPSNNLMLFDVENSYVFNTKTLKYPYAKSFGKVLDFARYGVNQAGGQLSIVRDADSKKMLLSYYQSTDHSSQEIALKKNLIDYNEKHNFEELFTSLILYDGSGDGEKITLDSIQDNLYTSDLLSRTFGVIIKAQKIDENFDRENIAESINAILASAEQDFLSITVKMFDMSIVDPFLSPMRVGDIVTIRTKDTRLEEVTTEIETHLNEPEKNQYSFGVSPRMLSRYITESTSILEIEG